MRLFLQGVIESLQPMADEGSQGRGLPVDLALRDEGSSFAPAVALVGVSIPKHLSDGVVLPAIGVSPTPIDAQGSPLPGAEGPLDGASVRGRRGRGPAFGALSAVGLSYASRNGLALRPSIARGGRVLSRRYWLERRTQGGSLGRWMRFACRAAALVCGVVAFSMVGVAPAAAEGSVSHRPEGITEYELIADNYGGIVESEPEYTEPPGYYVEGWDGGGDGVYQYREECEEGNIFEKCVGLHTVVTENIEGELPSGFVKLEHVRVESDYRGIHSVSIYRFGWKPESELFGEGNEGEPGRRGCFAGKPVNCATGNQVVTQTDLSVGGRGPALKLTRTYNSMLAATQSTAGPFGFGWTGSYSAHLAVNKEGTEATVYQDNASTVTFTRSGEAWAASSSLAEATLADEGSGYVYTLPDQTKLAFNSEGRLTKETDRNGNAITLAYNAEKQLESATDGAGRKLTFKYNGSGEIESVTDPMGHAVKYTYESGNLASVTQPGEAKLRWKFKYNSAHELTSETDGREHTATTEYNEADQVVSQTDAMSRKRAWSYVSAGSGIETTITEPNGAVTVEKFNYAELPTSVTHASGTSNAATTTYEYNSSRELIAVTDPNKHKTEYEYNGAGDRTLERDANGDETKRKYDATHDIETKTTPDGETTTIKRNSKGDPEVIERPAPGSTTQKTTYKYASNGDVESMTDPLEHTWKYEYDSYGDRKSETDPEGNKRTWEYNEDSQETATVSPRGNVTGGKPTEFTTKTERDAQGRPIKITDPLSHTTKYTYDGDGNPETLTDPNSNTTKYTYDSDNELTKTEEPNKAITETEYDSMGQVKSQTDGNKHTTKYEHNLLEEVTEVIDPRERKTIKEYDSAGNLTSLTDAAKRTTTYTYDPGNRLKEVSYSDGKTHAVEYEYNKDGKVTVIKDGSGTTKDTYDQLDRVTEAENGHKEVIKYEYNLANKPTKIKYPNGKEITRSYDKDDRLEKVTDWNSKATSFSYDQDSELKAITFPSETKDEDTYAYNDADRTTEAKLKKSSETLASLVYTRDSDGQVKTITSKGLPGEEKPAYEYDKANRLTKGAGTAYEYDAANNPTRLGSGTYKYDSADELETGPSVKYAYNEVGERTKITPETGSATTYGYDQAGSLISLERPKEGEKAAIEDSYAYNGEGLRTSQTISGTTTYLAWQTSERLPLLLSDGTNSYIYGPEGLSVEQINNSTGTATYLHHDQAGSTRLLTGSTGKSAATFTYDAYGNQTGHTGTATTPLGYDAQYTSADTGLIYLRARVYDPATAQFLTVDPLVRFTRAVYTYAQDNPANRADLTGLCTGFGPALAGCAGGPSELGPRVFCKPTKQETEQSEKEEEENYKNEEEESRSKLAGQEAWGSGGNPYGGEPKDAPPEVDPE